MESDNEVFCFLDRFDVWFKMLRVMTLVTLISAIGAHASLAWAAEERCQPTSVVGAGRILGLFAWLDTQGFRSDEQCLEIMRIRQRYLETDHTYIDEQQNDSSFRESVFIGKSSDIDDLINRFELSEFGRFGASQRDNGYVRFRTLDGFNTIDGIPSD